jgi:glycosyltransferase EpsE
MNNQPLVSVIMATYNDKPELLVKAIDSIINQTEKDLELIIVDDSNDENTIRTLSLYSNIEKRIHLIRSPQRLGFVASLNKGFFLAKGKYIARMDGDDISMPMRLQKELSFLENNPQYDIIGSSVNIINEYDYITAEIKFPKMGLRLLLFSIFRCPLQHGDIMMRRTIFDKGLIYDESFKKAEDLELWLRAIKEGHKLYNLKETLYSFRIQNDYAQKRNAVHFSYNLRARIKNFTWKQPLLSILGILVSYIYLHIPYNIKEKVYNYINNKNANVETAKPYF